MKALEEWANKNPKQAGIAAAAMFLLTGLILFMYFKGSSGGSVTPTANSNSPSGTSTASSGGANTTSPGSAPTNTTPGGPPASGGAPGAGGAAGAAGAGAAGGATDANSLVKGPPPAGRPNPMAPYWVWAVPAAPSGFGSGFSGGPLPIPPVGFTPPTPGTPELSSGYFRYYGTTDAQPPLVNTTIPGSSGGGGIETASNSDRMAGVLYGQDRVMAVVERQSDDPTQPAASYVVQPGDMVGPDQVVAISPNSVTLRKADGTLENVPMRSGSLKGLAPASAAATQPGYGAGMPGGGGYTPAGTRGFMGGPPV